MLDENIRNTRQIAQLFGSLGARQARYRGMDGPPVRFVQRSPDEAIHEADSQVDRLLGEGWEPGQIALLGVGGSLNRRLRPDPISHTSTGLSVAPFQGKKPLVDLFEIPPTDAMEC